jgi:hypothetical protein
VYDKLYCLVEVNEQVYDWNDNPHPLRRFCGNLLNDGTNTYTYDALTASPKP